LHDSIEYPSTHFKHIDEFDSPSIIPVEEEFALDPAVVGSKLCSKVGFTLCGIILGTEVGAKLFDDSVKVGKALQFFL
jgi:hypothetical protein